MIRFYRKFFRAQYPGGLIWLVGLAVWLRFAAVVVRLQGRKLLRRTKAADE